MRFCYYGLRRAFDDIAMRCSFSPHRDAAAIDMFRLPPFLPAFIAKIACLRFIRDSYCCAEILSAISGHLPADAGASSLRRDAYRLTGLFCYCLFSLLR